jgi:hypothetical protein
MENIVIPRIFLRFRRAGGDDPERRSQSDRVLWINVAIPDCSAWRDGSNAGKASHFIWKSHGK